MAKQSPTYISWAAMLTRVRNPNREDWPLYGGRGIGVCKRWLKYKNFLDDMGERPEGRTLDRINNDKDYKPSNCRWATTHEQRVNQRPGAKAGEKNGFARLTLENVHEIREEFDNKYMTIKRLATKFNVSFGCIAKVVYNQTWQGG